METSANHAVSKPKSLAKESVKTILTLKTTASKLKKKPLKETC
jgi:hypothetical protein